MTGLQVLDIARDGIWVMIIVAAPMMIVGLVVGVVIALFQALTQIQEMTLVFVPKIIAIFVAMLIALPQLAVMASFALQKFQSSASALIDWFSVFFFTAGAIFLWLYYTALQVGWPAKFLANVRKLAQGYEPEFSLLTFVLALLGTLAWLWLVRWRTARHRHAIWKSLALPAGGVALAWLLAMTLGLHPLNYARSNKPLVDRIAAHVPRDVDCIAAPSLPTHALAALEFQGHWRVDATQNLAATACSIAISVQGEGTPTPPSGWKVLGVVRRPTDRFATYLVMQKDR